MNQKNNYKVITFLIIPIVLFSLIQTYISIFINLQLYLPLPELQQSFPVYNQLMLKVIIVSLVSSACLAIQGLFLAESNQCQTGICFKCPYDYVQIDKKYCIKSSVLTNHQNFLLSSNRSQICQGNKDKCQCSQKCPQGYSKKVCDCVWGSESLIRLKGTFQWWMFIPLAFLCAFAFFCIRGVCLSCCPSCWIRCCGDCCINNNYSASNQTFMLNQFNNGNIQGVNYSFGGVNTANCNIASNCVGTGCGGGGASCGGGGASCGGGGCGGGCGG